MKFPVTSLSGRMNIQIPQFPGAVMINGEVVG